jgi:glyoxylase-like metal-dependent hydrolase (beta-lactamase superfamily II)
MKKTMLQNHQFQVTPLKVAQIKLCKAELTYNVDFSTQLWAPVFVYVLKDSDSKGVVLVDSGFEPDFAESNTRGGRTQLKRALRSVNVDPEKVRSLILTHLHNDHSSFLNLFRQARIFLQATELSYAHNPLPTQRLFYNRSMLKHLEKADVELLRGDRRIETGLRVLHTPGHTPGSQTVLVDTRKGVYALCGDTVPMFHNWFPSDARFGTRVGWPRIPPGGHTDLQAWFESARKIEMSGASIIPSHDPRLRDRRSIP